MAVESAPAPLPAHDLPLTIRSFKMFCKGRRRSAQTKCSLQEPPREGSAPRPAHEAAEDDEAPSDEEVAAMVANDPADRAPGQEVGILPCPPPAVRSSAVQGWLAKMSRASLPSAQLGHRHGSAPAQQSTPLPLHLSNFGYAYHSWPRIQSCGLG